MDHKAAARTRNINNMFGPGTPNKCTLQWWFKKFCKGTGALKKRNAVAGHWKSTMTNWVQSSKLIFLRPQKLLKNSALNILWSFANGSKLKRWKSLINGVPCELITNQKKRSFWSVVFSYSMQQHWTISQLDCYLNLKVDLDNNRQWPAQRLQQEKLQSTSQRQTCTKKRSGSLSGGLLLIWSAIAFWIPVKPLHLRSMLSKLMRRTKNCNACSRHSVNRVGPILLQNNARWNVAQSTLQKFNKLGY